MNRREFLALAMGAAGGMMAAVRAASTVRPPNIVLILVDDLGWRDLGCYDGAMFETPHIDGLARDGLRFTQAYANCPVCSPSRAALMTGKSPARSGFTGHITAIGRHRHPEGSRLLPPDDKLYLPLEERTLAETLKDAGYTSASIGKWHLGPEGFWPEDQGFDVNVAGWTHGSPPSYVYPYTDPKKEWNPSIPTLHGGEEGEYLTDRLTNEGISFIESHREHPFFLYLTHYAVHTPLQAPKELIRKYENKLEGHGNTIDPVYAAMVENLDTNVGRVLHTLRRLGLEKDTLVVLASDNGGLLGSSSNAPLREGKGWLYEGGIRTPLILRWPGHIPAATVSEEPVIGCDLFSTLVDVGGGTQPGVSLDGVSLAPLWQGAEHLDREALYWYYPHYQGKAQRPGAAIRKGRYKLIETYDPEEIELYDLEADLSEQHNLAQAMPDTTAALLEDLREYLRRVEAIPPTPNPAYRGE